MDKMTEQMAIEYGKDYLKDLICACCKVEDTHKEFVRLSIQALEKQSMVNEILNELKQYRAIGTVKEIKIREAQFQRLSEGYLIDLTSLREYRELGTIADLQALKEKSVAKKVIVYGHNDAVGTDVGLCPMCNGRPLRACDNQYCSDCGQHLNWE